MKKNKMMRVASVLLVAVLLTTSVISGTFAKYTTQDSAGDNARVAKWGVELQVAGLMYGDHYAAGTVAPSAYATANTATVTADAQGTKVVAPGTKNDDGISFSLNGTPEVSGVITAEIAYENIYLMTGEYGVMIKRGTVSEADYTAVMALADATEKYYVKSGSDYTLATAWAAATEYYTLEDYVNLTENYYPVEYKMTGTTTSYNTGYTTATTVDQLAAVATAVGAKFGTADTTATTAGKTTLTFSTGTSFNPNQDLATVMKLEGQKIAWKWDFENGTGTNSGNAATMYSKADTILGNLAGTLTANGEVVKNSSGTWSAPTAAAGTDANDFNLETEFSIDITVTQVD